MLSTLMKLLHAPIYETRLKELALQITPHLRERDKVLDVGCGFGALGKAVLESPDCPPLVKFSGLEKIERGGEFIPVETYEGSKIPYVDNAFDVVILADVLHHEENPHQLIDECARVTKRLLIIKDHKVDGILAQQRISLLDWAANMPYDIKCLYKYNTATEWQKWHEIHHLTIEKEVKSMQLYPPLFNLFFGRRLHYFAVLKTA